MTIISEYNNINQQQWRSLASMSPVNTWFQTPECYELYASLPEMFRPFVCAVAEDDELRGVCVGYITVEKNPLKQLLTRRAIINAGPLLAPDITDEELKMLLRQVKVRIEELGGAIYIETRNFNSYEKWLSVFEECGFAYEPHLNFHIDTTSPDIVEQNLGKSRKRDIRVSFRDGAFIVDHPTIEQVREYYAILRHLYTTKVKTPLFPLSFFEALYRRADGRFLLVALRENPDGSPAPADSDMPARIVGGTVCVEYSGVGVYEWFAAGMDGEWKTISPSCVATYAGVRYAAEHGCPRFDMMGAGTPDEAYGVRDFKAKFGGALVEHGRFKCIAKPLFYKIGVLGVKILKHK